MSAMVWRLLIAIVVVLFAWMIVPAALHIFGLPMSQDVETVVRGAIGLIAVLYVLAGPPPWPPKAA